MRKKSFLSPVLLAMIFILFSCKKENLDAEKTKPPSYENLIPKIKSWIEEQKKGLSTVSVARIDSLKLNLGYDEVRMEKYKGSSELIVIPILSGFKSKNNTDKNPANYLVLVFEDQDSITGGNIIQYISSNSQKAAPQNTFNKIFTYQDLDCSGQFTMLSITDDFRYELKFENGKLRSMAWLKKKSQSNSVSGRVTECIDWYLQTWYIWSDGSMTLQSEVFLFTTCGEDCAQPRVANGRSFRVNCSGGGNGGGGYDSGGCPTTPQEGEAALTSITSTILVDGISETGDEIGPDANGVIERPVVVKQHQLRYTFPGERTGTYTLYFPGVLFKPTNNSQWKWKELAFSHIGLSEGDPGCFAVDFTPAISLTIDPDKLNARFIAAITATLKVSCLGGFVLRTKPEHLNGVYPASDF